MPEALPTRPRQAAPRWSYAIVASSYNAEYVQGLVDHAAGELKSISQQAKVRLHQVPGAFEIPLLVKELALSERYNAIIALGVVIRGETAHADLIARSVFEALQRIALEQQVPVINEVLLVDNEEQARVRCLEEEINRGTEAARAAVEISETLHEIRSRIS